LNTTAGTGRVYLSCTTTAPKATCSINSGDSLNQYTVDFSKSASGTATVNVTTTTNAAASLRGTPGRSRREFLASTLGLLGFVLVGIVLIPANWARNVRRGLGGAGLMLALVMHPGCGGGSSGGGSSGVGGGGGGTTPGSYSVTVNAYTVSNSGNPDSTKNIPLTVN
jgi:hypothetical protein